MKQVVLYNNENMNRYEYIILGLFCCSVLFTVYYLSPVLFVIPFLVGSVDIKTYIILVLLKTEQIHVTIDNNLMLHWFGRFLHIVHHKMLDNLRRNFR